MNRKISFRGYNLKNKKWLYGYYIVNRGKHYIVQDEVAEPFSEQSDFEVAPESVGQWVCQYKDIDVYEGDILMVLENGLIEIHEGKVIYDPKHNSFIVSGEISSVEEERDYRIGMSEICMFTFKYILIGNEYEEKNK